MPNIGDIITGKEIGKTSNEKYPKYIWVACGICGRERWTPLYKQAKRCKHCTNFGRIMPRGDKARHWKGGYINQKGYRLIKLTPDDFFFPMTDKRGYVMEHRLTMAKSLNRCLLSWEIVHHKEGIPKDDNRLEGLQLFPTQTRHDVLTKMAIYIKRLEREIERLRQIKC